MKINLYQALLNSCVLPIKSSTANLILSGNNKFAALSLLADYKQYKTESGYFLQKKDPNKKQNPLTLNVDPDNEKQSRYMGDFNLSNFECNPLASLIKDEVDAAKSEEENETISEIQWLR
jgi:hypothetical protein